MGFTAGVRAELLKNTRTFLGEISLLSKTIGRKSWLVLRWEVPPF